MQKIILFLIQYYDSLGNISQWLQMQFHVDFNALFYLATVNSLQLG